MAFSGLLICSMERPSHRAVLKALYQSRTIFSKVVSRVQTCDASPAAPEPSNNRGALSSFMGMGVLVHLPPSPLAPERSQIVGNPLDRGALSAAEFQLFAEGRAFFIETLGQRHIA